MKAECVRQVRRFYEAHRQSLYSYALALTSSREAAEDAVHTAFCGLLERGEAPLELRPYMFRCVRNAAVDGLRERRAVEADLLERPGPRADGMDDGLRETLGRALALLSEDERGCVVLKVWESMTFREIGESLGVPLNTASSWYHRALEKMRAVLEDEVL